LHLFVACLASQTASANFADTCAYVYSARFRYQLQMRVVVKKCITCKEKKENIIYRRN